MYDNLVVRTQCADSDDTLTCLRGLSAEFIQSVNFNTPFPGAQGPPLYMYGPTIDNDLIPDYTYNLFAHGRFIHVPTIFGDDSNGGTIFTPKKTSNISASDTFLHDQFPALTLADLREINALYPKTNDSFPNSGLYWRQVSNAYGELRYMCPGLFCSSAYTNISSHLSWNYRYNVLDPTAVAEGLGVPHTVEVNAIWGPENVNGGAPASYAPGKENAGIVPVIQGYWTSFIRALDPNVYRVEGSPEWKAWGTGGTWRRLKIQTNATEMEDVDSGLKMRCRYLYSIGPSIRQ
jgi:carboxylesterase type B